MVSDTPGSIGQATRREAGTPPPSPAVSSTRAHGDGSRSSTPKEISVTRKTTGLRRPCAPPADARLLPDKRQTPIPSRMRSTTPAAISGSDRQIRRPWDSEAGRIGDQARRPTPVAGRNSRRGPKPHSGSAPRSAGWSRTSSRGLCTTDKAFDQPLRALESQFLVGTRLTC